MKRLTSIFFILTFVLFSVVSISAEERLYLMFAAQWDTDAVKIVKEYFGNNDYLGYDINNNKSKVFFLPPNIAKLSNLAEKYCPKQKVTVIYDPEHWEHTPIVERENLSDSIFRTVRISKEFKCNEVGIAPDGKMIGLYPKACAGDISSLARNIDWNNIDLIILQAQRLLSDSCVKEGGINNYVKFIRKWTETIKKANPNVKVFASMSFRYTHPSVMIQVIDKLKDIVDGFYLAYPKSEGKLYCVYCNPENLKIVIKHAKGIN